MIHIHFIMKRRKFIFLGGKGTGGEERCYYWLPYEDGGKMCMDENKMSAENTFIASNVGWYKHQYY